MHLFKEKRTNLGTISTESCSFLIQLTREVFIFSLCILGVLECWSVVTFYILAETTQLSVMLNASVDVLYWIINSLVDIWIRHSSLASTGSEDPVWSQFPLQVKHPYCILCIMLDNSLTVIWRAKYFSQIKLLYRWRIWKVCWLGPRVSGWVEQSEYLGLKPGLRSTDAFLSWVCMFTARIDLACEHTG